MCGLTGYWDLSGGNSERLPTELVASVRSLDHRGPDDSGSWTEENRSLGLGHARLSILDLSNHGHQPMLSSDGRFVLVFNGEIYNFQEIREDLEKCGHHFQGTGDTEVLLASFQEWGKACVQRFIGMFAFAVWDRQKKYLSLCRDRVGVKPLYYGWDGKVFIFGSELKALRAYTCWNPEVNRQALGEYFQYGYIAAPRSIYKNVYKLLPGHSLEIAQKERSPRVTQYWSLQDVVAQGYLQDSEEVLTDRLEELLTSAFQYRMVADVPVGVFLSGGIDSSIVAAILQKHADSPIHTYTIGFKDKAHDESIWAKKIADHLGTQHTEFILDLDRAKDIIPDLADIFDEPFGDSSGIPTTMVSELARQEVTVALSADGGDELFVGYNNYPAIQSRFTSIVTKPAWMRHTAGILAKSMPYNAISLNMGDRWPFSSRYMQKLAKIRGILPQATVDAVYRASISHFMPEEVSQLIGGYEDPRQSVENYQGSFQEQMTQWDVHNYLPDDILAKVDRATMSVGLEGREPLLDHRLIEFAFRLPMSMRVGSLGQKHLLRKVLYRHVPREMIDRPKQGFGVPIGSWLKGNDRRMLKQIKDTSALSHLGINSKMIGREINGLVKSGSNEMRVWLLFVLSQWASKWDV